jgi:hypothetical protein
MESMFCQLKGQPANITSFPISAQSFFSMVSSISDVAQAASPADTIAGEAACATNRA